MAAAMSALSPSLPGAPSSSSSSRQRARSGQQQQQQHQQRRLPGLLPAPQQQQQHQQHAHHGHRHLPSRLAATRDVRFAYQGDIQVKLKPGVFAERQEDRFAKVAAASDWRSVLGLFRELGQEAIERNPSIVAEMLAALQRLVSQQQPQQQQQQQAGGLTSEDATALAHGIHAMSATLADTVTKLSPRAFTTAVWALALLPSPAKLLADHTASDDAALAKAADARARTVAVFGAFAISKLGRLKAEEVFHLLAGLHLLGFAPPQTLAPQPRASSTAGSSNSSRSSKEQPAPAATAPRSFASLLESRSIKVLPYLSAKGAADAAFVVARMVAPGTMSREWLQGYAKVSKQHLPEMEPEALVHAGFALARQGLLPSNSWRKAYLSCLAGCAKSLAGDEFPIVCFTLARWQALEAEAGSSGSGGSGGSGAASWPDGDDGYDEDAGLDGGGFFSSSTAATGADWGAAQQPAGSPGATASSFNPATAPPQALIDELLLASHANRALRELPIAQLVAMLQALAVLQQRVGTAISPMWLKRVWPAVEAQLDAAAGVEGAGSSSSSSGGGGRGAAAAAAEGVAALAPDLAGLLEVLGVLAGRQQQQLALPADFVDTVVCNLGLGLTFLRPAQLAGAWRALRALQHAPDAIFLQQLRPALLAAMQGKAVLPEVPALLEAGLQVAAAGAAAAAAGGPSSSSNDDSGSSFCQQLVDAVLSNFDSDLNDYLASMASSTLQLQQGSTRPSSKLAATAPQQAKWLQERVAAAAAAERHGWWAASQSTLEMVRVVADAAAAAAAAQPPDSARVALLQGSVLRMQQLWQRATVGVAARMPTQQLLDLLRFLDGSSSNSSSSSGGDGNDGDGDNGGDAAAAGPVAGLTAEDCALLELQHDDGCGVGPPSLEPVVAGQPLLRLLTSRQQVISAVLDASVRQGILADAMVAPARRKSKGAARAAAAAAAAGVCDPAASFLHSFTASDVYDLLGLLADSGSSAKQQQSLCDASLAVVSGALAAPEPAYGLGLGARDLDDAAALFEDLKLVWRDLGLKVPARLSKRMDAWLQEARKAAAAAAEAEAAAAAAALMVPGSVGDGYYGGEDAYGSSGETAADTWSAGGGGGGGGGFY